MAALGGIMGRKVTRRGNWTYDPDISGWRLNETPIAIYYESAERCYLALGGPKNMAQIDRYVDGAMAYVERHQADYLPADVTSPCDSEQVNTC